jgi:anaerobic magnesium-protoporphyrin IX monomethyl ester cyclase
MFVLLIHPQIRTTEPPQHPPYGLLQLASLTDQLGYKVAILDDNALRLPTEAIRQDIKNEAESNKHPWDVIGITGLTTQYKFIKQLVPICREQFPEAVIVGGGGFMTAQPREMLKWLPQMDIGCIGEAYITFPEILEHVNDRDWKRIKGLVYRDGGITRMTPMRPLVEEYYYCEKHKPKHFTFEEAQKQDYRCKECDGQLINNLDEVIPFPGYEWSPLDTYLIYSAMPYAPECMTPQTRRLDVLTSYGCPWRCSFCFHLGSTPYCQSKIYGKKVVGKEFRQHSPEYVVRLMTHLRLKYCINFVSFIDENLTVKRSWFMRFCELLEESELATLIRWGMVVHSRTVDGDLLKKARDVGCSYISYGGETFSEHILKEIGKGQTKEQMVAAIQSTQAAGINPIMSFIVGFPSTTIDDIIGDLEAYIENQIHVNPFFLQPYPGSQYFTEFKDKIIEQHLTDEEKTFIAKPSLDTFTKYFDRATKDGWVLAGNKEIPSKSLLQKQTPKIISDIKDNALQRWVLSLDDATQMSVNLTNFNDVELAGLRYLMSTEGVRLASKTPDLERLKKFKKLKEALEVKE